MFSTGLRDIPSGWDSAILGRANAILGRIETNCLPKQSWFEAIQRLSQNEQGLFLVWLAITGCYPNKRQMIEFSSNVQVHGLRISVSLLLRQRSLDANHSIFIERIVLVDAKHTKLVDVTHTSSMSYLTGIQRVVYGVTQNIKGISTFIWLGNFGIINEKELNLNSVSRTSSTSEESRNKRIINYLHSLVPILDKSPFGKEIRRLLLPIARRLKRMLLKQDILNELEKSNSHSIQNVLILNTEVTIPEIPSQDNISCYEAIIDFSSIEIQLILYDFIPLFHAWTVHPDNRGNLNLYLRLVLLAHRVISISELVHEQAQLISKAFRLERNSWQERPQKFDFLALPSGLDSASPDEFKKDPTLVVMAGSLEPRKNHLQFLDALEILTSQEILVKGEILGSAGWENDFILNRIHSLQAKGVSISRRGNLSDSEIRDRIGKAQVLLQISEAEGFGLPISEALSLGTKVIVSNVRPLKEWVGERVQSVNLGDSRSLALMLAKILENPEVNTQHLYSSVTWNDWAQILYSR